MHRGLQQASSPRLTPEERKRSQDAIAIPQGMRARARLGNRGAVPRAGGRRPGPGPHTGGTHIQHTYVQAHVSGSLRAGTRRQGHGRHRRTYCQGGDSDWAALRALRAVEAPPGSWAKIARTHESGISFGRYDVMNKHVQSVCIRVSAMSRQKRSHHASRMSRSDRRAPPTRTATGATAATGGPRARKRGNRECVLSRPVE